MDSIRRKLSADSRRILRRFSADPLERNLRTQDELSDAVALSAFWPALNTLMSLNLVQSVKNGYALTTKGYEALEDLSRERTDLPWGR